MLITMCIFMCTLLTKRREMERGVEKRRGGAGRERRGSHRTIAELEREREVDEDEDGKRQVKSRDRFE